MRNEPGVFVPYTRVQKAVRRFTGLSVRLWIQGDRHAYGCLAIGVAVLAEDQELSPNGAADVPGISRPLVVHRMDIGDLPFRYCRQIPSCQVEGRVDAEDKNRRPACPDGGARRGRRAPQAALWRLSPRWRSRVGGATRHDIRKFVNVDAALSAAAVCLERRGAFLRQVDERQAIAWRPGELMVRLHKSWASTTIDVNRRPLAHCSQAR